MPNFKRIGGGPWKSSDDLTWNDPVFTCSSVKPSGWEGRVGCLPVVLSSPLAGQGGWVFTCSSVNPSGWEGRVGCLPVVLSTPLAGKGGWGVYL